jgi:hypothetical protein
LDGDTKPEHILLNALGGRKTTKKAICSECNHFFGTGPDQDLAESVKMLRNFAQLDAGDGDPPPRVPGAETDDGRYELSSSGKPIYIPNKAYSVEQNDTGFDVELHASNIEHGERLVENAARDILKKLGKNDYPAEHLQAIKNNLWASAKRTFSKPPALQGQHEFGSNGALRSMAKATLALIAENQGSEHLRGAKFQAIRDFCLTGRRPDAWDYWVHLDDRDLPNYPSKFGTNPNLIWVGSNWFGQVYGYFRLYNIMGWRFRLCEFGGTPNTSVCLISNPLDPSIWEIRSGSRSLLTHQWVEEVAANNLSSRSDRMKALVSQGQMKSFSSYFASEIAATFEQVIGTSNTAPTDEQIDEVRRIIRNKFLVFSTGHDWEEPLSAPSSDGG